MSLPSSLAEFDKKNPKIRRYEDKRREVVSLVTKGLQQLHNKFLQDVKQQLDQLVIRVAEIEEEQHELLVEKENKLVSAVDENSQLRQHLLRCEAELTSKSREVDNVERQLDEKTNTLLHLEARLATALEVNLQLTEAVIRIEERASTAEETEAVKKKIIEKDERLKQLEETIDVKDEQLRSLQADLLITSEKLKETEEKLKECRLQLQISKKLAQTTKIRQLEMLQPSSEIKSMIEQLREETNAVNRYIQDCNSARKLSDGCRSVDDPDRMTKPKSSLPAHLQRLQQVRQQVVDKLEAKKVAVLMFQCDALTIGELESVLSRKISIKAATTLVELIMRKKSEEEFYFCFLEALKTSEQRHILTLLSFADQNMDDEHVKLMQTHYSYLIENLDLRNVDVLGQLYSRKVLDLADMEDLDSEFIHSRRVWKLLLMLSKKSAQQFNEFLDVLETTHQQHVVYRLRRVHLGCLSVTHVILTDEDRYVVGVTSVNNQLFVLRSPSRQEIEVYDTTTFTFQRKLPVYGLSDLFSDSNSLTSCISNNCLYVGDCGSKTVNKVELTSGDKVSKWKIGIYPVGLSVNTACNVLVTCSDGWGVSKIFEFTTGGRVIREIKKVQDLLHSIELTGGQFVACQDPSDVIVVDKEGRVVVSYENNKQSTDQLMNRPSHLAVDKNDCILVADTRNDRVVMLNSSLSCARDLPVTLDSGLNRPSCLHYDESRGRLLIGESGGKKRVIVIDNIRSFQPT